MKFLSTALILFGAQHSKQVRANSFFSLSPPPTTPFVHVAKITSSFVNIIGCWCCNQLSVSVSWPNNLLFELYRLRWSVSKKLWYYWVFVQRWSGMSLLLGGVHLTHGFGHSTHWRSWLLHWSESCTIWPSPTSVNENVAQQFLNLWSNQLLFTIIFTPSHWAYSNDTTLMLKSKQMNVTLILNTCFIWQFLMIHILCSQRCGNMCKYVKTSNMMTSKTRLPFFLFTSLSIFTNIFHSPLLWL